MVLVFAVSSTVYVPKKQLTCPTGVRGLVDQDFGRLAVSAAGVHRIRPGTERCRRRGTKVPESLSGNPITVTGKIDLYKGRPEIVISSSAQIVKY